MPVKVLLVEDDSTQRKLVGTQLVRRGYDVLAVDSGKSALESLKTARPDVILMDVLMPDMDGFSVSRQIRADASFSQIPIIMLTALDNVENKVRGFQAGADDYISKPCEPEELVARIKALLRRTEPSTHPAAPGQVACVISVFSLRGGSGVSTISVNLAAGLAQLWGASVALVDMASSLGHSVLLLNQSLHNTWADLGRLKVEEIDEDVVLGMLQPHPSRVQTLSSPTRPEQAAVVSPEATGRVLEILRGRFPYVVMDMPHDLGDRSLVALDHSDTILLVIQPEIASLRAASIALEEFEALQFKDKQVKLLLNWTFPHNGLLLKDIERILKSKVDFTLPYAADELIAALNLGKPPVLENPEGSLGIIFEDFAMALSKEEHRNSRPPAPTPAWQRVTERIRRRK